ncbi:MAG TPA: hypothetical protein VJ999_13190 [Candidatus Sulfotelmatobacter sp.]|nr:hypothetical protein [Candidatus Sulfotelmatobacter sp.]
MRSSSEESNLRQGNRTKAVLPVRVKGTDSSGAVFEELAHTLDVNPAGIRLGSVRRMLNVMDEVTVLYRGRKLQYRVVWVKQMKGTSEFQVGLQAIAQDGEAWGLGSTEQKVHSTLDRAVSHASGVA